MNTKQFPRPLFQLFNDFITESHTALQIDSASINEKIDLLDERLSGELSKIKESIAEHRSDLLKAADMLKMYITVVNASLDKIEKDVGELQESTLQMDDHIEELYDAVFEDVDDETCDECGQPLDQHKEEQNDE